MRFLLKSATKRREVPCVRVFCQQTHIVRKFRTEPGKNQGVVDDTQETGGLHLWVSWRTPNEQSLNEAVWTSDNVSEVQIPHSGPLTRCQRSTRRLYVEATAL